MDKYEDYFDPTGQLFVLYSAAGAKKSYYPCTYRNQEMVKGLLTYTYPDAPDVTPVQDTQQYGWYGLYFSAAETNFFLAEFTLLGATWNGQKSAQEYFTDGITASVKGYDYVAGQNHIPYYDSPYVNDPHDVSIKLQEEWADYTKMIGDFAKIKQDELQTEDTTCHFYPSIFGIQTSFKI